MRDAPIPIAPEAYQAFAATHRSAAGRSRHPCRVGGQPTVPMLDIEAAGSEIGAADRLTAMLRDPGAKHRRPHCPRERTGASPGRHRIGRGRARPSQDDHRNSAPSIAYSGRQAVVAGIDLSPVKQAVAAAGPTSVSSLATLISFLAAIVPWLPLIALLVRGARVSLRRWKRRRHKRDLVFNTTGWPSNSDGRIAQIASFFARARSDATSERRATATMPRAVSLIAGCLFARSMTACRAQTRTIRLLIGSARASRPASCLASAALSEGRTLIITRCQRTSGVPSSSAPLSNLIVCGSSHAQWSRLVFLKASAARMLRSAPRQSGISRVPRSVRDGPQLHQRQSRRRRSTAGPPLQNTREGLSIPTLRHSDEVYNTIESLASP